MYKQLPKEWSNTGICHSVKLFSEMKRTVVKCCIGGGGVGNMHHKKHNGLMLIHRLAAAQGCLLSSDINIGETSRRLIFLFLGFYGGGRCGRIFSPISLTMPIPLGIPPICLSLKLLNVLQLPQQLDSQKDLRCRKVGASHCPIGVSQFWGFVYIIQDLVSNKRTEWGENNYVECVLG